MSRDSARLMLTLSAIMLSISVILYLYPAAPKKKQVSKNESAFGTPGDLKLAVARVIDGDTYVLSDSSQVRLIGIDTPERRQPFYIEAKAFAESTVLGKMVSLEFDKEPFDNYGRRLAYLYLDTLLLNEELVKAGLATIYLFENNTRYAENLISAQKEARNSAKGLWSLKPPAKENYYVNISGSMRFHRPLCPHLKDALQSRLRKINTREEAMDSGLSPCRFCRP